MHAPHSRQFLCVARCHCPPQIVVAARAAASENAGFECCYGIYDAAVEVLSALNDSAIECCVCLSPLDDSDEATFTAACFHSFHDPCLFKWVSLSRTKWLEENLSDDSPTKRLIAAYRGEVTARANVEAEVCNQLDHVTCQVATWTHEVEVSQAALEVSRCDNDSLATAEAQTRLWEAERTVSQLVKDRQGLKGKMKAAALRREEAEARLAREEGKVREKVTTQLPTAPCPVCRVSVDWSPDLEAGYSSWCASQAAPSPAGPQGAEDAAAALPDLDPDTRAYLDAFRARVTALMETQRANGGIIDGPPPTIVIGATPTPVAEATPLPALPTE